MNHTSRSPMNKALILLTVLLCCMAAAPQNAAAQSSMRTSSPVPPQVELMYVKGLRYLQNAQKTDGTYDGTYGQEPGIIGFCLMSVLAHGDDPNTGPYATMVRLAEFGGHVVRGHAGGFGNGARFRSHVRIGNALLLGGGHVGFSVRSVSGIVSLAFLGAVLSFSFAFSLPVLLFRRLGIVVHAQ